MFATCSLPLFNPGAFENLLTEHTEGLALIFPDQNQRQSQEERRNLEDDLIAWGQYYLSHHFKNPPSAMHREIAALLDAGSTEQTSPASRKRQRPEEPAPTTPGANAAGSPDEITSSRPHVFTPPLRLNLLAPRASAKSTLVTLSYVLREALLGKEPYIWIISDTKRQAQSHLDNLSAELQDNRLLRSDYRRARRSTKSAGRITLGDVCIEAYGTGQRLRGHRWHEHRPTLIICDDLQNDGHIRSSAQRTRSRNWFHAMLMNAGTHRTKVINLGTALHREALAVKLHSAPGWTSRRFQAIQAWPTNMHLWAQWEELFCKPPSPEVSPRPIGGEREKVAVDGVARPESANGVVELPNNSPLQPRPSLSQGVPPTSRLHVLTSSHLPPPNNSRSNSTNTTATKWTPAARSSGPSKKTSTR